MNSKLEQAYLDWVKLRPFQTEQPAEYYSKKHNQVFKVPKYFDGLCCDGKHFRNKSVYKEKQGKQIYIGSEYTPLPDQEVCPRERAWRKYLSIRDGKDYSVK